MNTPNGSISGPLGIGICSVFNNSDDAAKKNAGKLYASPLATELVDGS